MWTAIRTEPVNNGRTNARFSAVKRHYEYRILTRRAPPILNRNRVWWTVHDLDADAMGEAAAVLVGRHDFTTFRAAQCQARSPVKTLDVFEVRRQRRRNRMPRLGTVVPAQSGPLDGRQSEARRRRQVDARRHGKSAGCLQPRSLRACCACIGPLSRRRRLQHGSDRSGPRRHQPDF